jgi:hypothetical protein
MLGSRGPRNAAAFVALLVVAACAGEESLPINDAPVARVAAALDASFGEQVTLDASASSDPNGDALTYAWEQVLGPSVGAIAASATPTVTAPSTVGTLRFQVVVRDPRGATSAPASVQVNVLEDRGRAVFVSKAGADTNDGSRASPLLTIQAAIGRAATLGGVAGVYVSEGTYEESLTLATKVHLYGGFGAQWVRDPVAAPTIVAGGTTAVKAESVSDVRMDGLEIRSADATAAGESSIGVLVVSTDGAVLTGSTIKAGAGATGAAGKTGARGEDGSGGDPGKDSADICLGVEPGGAGGAGPGFAGGHGGYGGCGAGGQTGAAGGGTPAAAGGAGGGILARGGDGGDGEDGAPGVNGRGGLSFGAVGASGYVPSAGGSGGGGAAGCGGGGGGGGGGFFLLVAWSGGGGGGGGAGGPGGGGGGRGGGGGASLGLALVASTGVEMDGVTISLEVIRGVVTSMATCAEASTGRDSVLRPFTLSAAARVDGMIERGKSGRDGASPRRSRHYTRSLAARACCTPRKKPATLRG